MYGIPELRVAARQMRWLARDVLMGRRRRGYFEMAGGAFRVW
jgi:hypothetical protein